MKEQEHLQTDTSGENPTTGQSSLTCPSGNALATNSNSTNPQTSMTQPNMTKTNVIKPRITKHNMTQSNITKEVGQSAEEDVFLKAVIPTEKLKAKSMNPLDDFLMLRTVPVKREAAVNVSPKKQSKITSKVIH